MQPIQRKESGKMRPFTIFFLAVVGIVILSSIFSSGTKDQTPVAVSAADTAAEQKKKDEKAKADKKETDRVAVVATAAYFIKTHLRNPSSVVWESMRANDDASIVCIEYRAQNGFGGMNREFLTVANGKGSQSAGAWNKSCRQALRDASGAETLLKLVEK